MKERRASLLFVVLLLAQLVLLTSQIRNRAGESHLERWALRLIAPFARGVSFALDAPGRVSDTFRIRRDLERENRELLERVQELELDKARLGGIERQVERLSDALGYKNPFAGQARLADVVYVDHSSWLSTLLIYVPGRWALENSPVTADNGLVGRVILREGPYAKVQLITDRASGIGAMVERTRRQGIVRGAAGDGLSLEYMPLQADIELGDRVITSGTDGIYPRGLRVGTVVELRESGELFREVRLAPTVDFGLLDQVFVLLGDAVPGGLKGTSSASP